MLAVGRPSLLPWLHPRGLHEAVHEAEVRPESQHVQGVGVERTGQRRCETEGGERTARREDGNVRGVAMYASTAREKKSG